MTKEVEAESLTSFEVSLDGQNVRFNGRSPAGEAVAFSLPADRLREMIMTLPQMFVEALRRRHADPSLKLVYPAGRWNVEQAVSDSGTYILTLATIDGFEVAFGLTKEQMAAVSKDLRPAESGAAVSPSLLN